MTHTSDADPDLQAIAAMRAIDAAGLNAGQTMLAQTLVLVRCFVRSTGKGIQHWTDADIIQHARFGDMEPRTPDRSA